MKMILTLLVPYALLVTSLPPPANSLKLVRLPWGQSEIEKMVE